MSYLSFLSFVLATGDVTASLCRNVYWQAACVHNQHQKPHGGSCSCKGNPPGRCGENLSVVALSSLFGVRTSVCVCVCVCTGGEGRGANCIVLV